MHVFDFITPEEIDLAPEDPAFAFAELVGHAIRRLDDFTKTRDLTDQDGWNEVEEARLGFMNVIVGLAKAYKIEPFANQDVPRFDNFNLNIHRQFKADLDHYITQLVVDNSLRAKRDATAIPPKIRERLRAYVNALREAVDASQLSETKRTVLHEKLDAFEAELNKRRLGLMAVAKMTIAIATVPGALWGSYEVVNRLTHQVLQAVGEAKAAEDENRQLPPLSAPAALLPPRKEEAETKGGFSQNLDDEIPF